MQLHREIYNDLKHYSPISLYILQPIVGPLPHDQSLAIYAFVSIPSVAITHL